MARLIEISTKYEVVLLSIKWFFRIVLLSNEWFYLVVVDETLGPLGEDFSFTELFDWR